MACPGGQQEAEGPQRGGSRQPPKPVSPTWEGQRRLCRALVTLGKGHRAQQELPPQHVQCRLWVGRVRVTVSFAWVALPPGLGRAWLRYR